MTFDKLHKCDAGYLLFALSFVMLFFCTFYNGTTFVEFGHIDALFDICRLAAACLIGFKCIYVDRYTFKKLVWVILMLLLGVITSYFSKRGAILDLVLLMVGASGIKPEKIVKLHFYCAAIFLAVCFLCSISGLIIDYKTYRTMNGVIVGENVRHSFGINYATDFAAHVLFLYLSYYYLHFGKKIKLIDYVVCFLIVTFLDYFCDARLSEGCILISLVLFTIAGKKEKLYESKIVEKVIELLFIACTVFSISTAYLYSASNEKWVLVDQMLFSKRLSVSNRVIRNYGFSLFGQNIRMQGLGYKVFGYDTSIGTTYLDSSYLQLIMLYGIVATIFFIVMLTILSRCAVKRKDTKMKIVIIVLALSCIMNQYLLSIAYNPFIIIAGGYILENRRNNPLAGRNLHDKETY